MRINLYIILLLSISFLACNKESEATIQEELKPFYESFLYEANLRNIVFSEADLYVSLELRNLDGSAGQCQHFSNAPDVAIVDFAAWENASTLKKEFLIFHELGHCILGRAHKDDKDDNGDCISIMHTDNTVCSFYYSESNRSDYLDELFNN